MKLRHYLAILVALAVLGVVGGGVFLQDNGGFAPMTISAIGEGTVEIHRGNEVIVVGESAESLEPQDLVVTGPRTDAKVNLEEGRVLTLARKSRLRIKSETAVEAQQGSLVAQATQPMGVLFDDVTARLSSATFRLDRGFGSARAASYEGTVRLESAGEPRIELTELEQVDVAAGDLPQQEPAPYHLGLGDAFDGQFIPDVVTLTQDLDLLATGFARQVGDTRPGIEYFSDLASGNVSFMRSYLSRPAEDLLVAFTIADNVPNGTFRQAFVKTFDLFDQGARYGVAATILDARAKPMVAQLRDLIVGTGAVAGDGGAGEPSFGDDTSTGGSPIAAGDDTSTGDDGPTVSGGVEGETREDVDDCGNVVDCGIQDVQDELPPGPSNQEPEEEEDPPDGGVLPGSGGGGSGGGGGTESGGGLLDDVLGNVPKVPLISS